MRTQDKAVERACLLFTIDSQELAAAITDKSSNELKRSSRAGKDTDRAGGGTDGDDMEGKDQPAMTYSTSTLFCLRSSGHVARQCRQGNGHRVFGKGAEHPGQQ